MEIRRERKSLIWLEARVLNRLRCQEKGATVEEAK